MLRRNPVGWVLGILLVLAVGYIIVSLLVENADLRAEREEVRSVVGALVTQNRGLPGEDGESAYETAVRLGFTGSESEWLASLRGAAGIPGVDGRAGAPGAAGRNGLSVGSVVCVGGTKLNWYLTDGTLIGSTKAVCIP